MKPQKDSCDLVLTRIYNAPVKVVWDAWAEDSQVSKWWGPRGFTITTKSKDFRTGGKWVYTMHSADGVDFPNVTTYLEVVPYQRMHYDHGGNETQKPLFRVDAKFSESDNKTTLNMTMTFESPEMALRMSQYIKDANGNSNWDRLGEYVEKEYNKRDVFLLSRVFETNIENLFSKFTSPSEIVKWQPPTGFDMRFVNPVEIKEGQSAFYEMGNSEVKFFGRSTYQKINPPKFISFVQEFCNESGENAKHPGAPVWPKMWLTSVSFASENNNQTRMTLESEIFKEHTSEELAAFIDARAGMTVGWMGSLDRLEELTKN